jgi:hypothetical protein
MRTVYSCPVLAFDGTPRLYMYCPSASRMTPLVSAEEDVPGTT